MRLNLKGGFFILSLIIFLLTSLFMSAGVSVSPGRVKLSFVPNAVYEGAANFGTGGRTNHLAISVDSSNFEIILDKEELFCDIEPCVVNYKVIMPASFDKPGFHGGSITAREVFDEDPGGFITVVVSMTMPISIEVPYPGKYLEFKSFEATNKDAGEEIPFVAVLVSKGDQVINSAKGIIRVYNKNNKLIGSISTNTWINIEPREEIKLYSMWDSGNNEKGRYHADIIVDYDGLKTNETTKFKLGGLDVELLNYTKEVIIGGIRPFYLLVESIWSEDIPNLKASVSVLVNDSDEITSFETLTKNLPAWGSVPLEGYLDTGPLNLSDYRIHITLFFEDLTKTYDGLISIIEEPSQVDETGAGLIKRIFTIKNILIVLIVLLVVMIIFLIYVLVPKRKKYKKE